MSVTEVQTEAAPFEVQPVTDSDVLTRAADLLEEFGWRQHGLFNPGSFPSDESCRDATQFCAVGAIVRARRDLGLPASDWSYTDPNGHYNLANRCFGEHIEGWTLAAWNDAPGRTKEEVVAKLREAAAR